VIGARGTLLSVRVGHVARHGTPGAADPLEREWTSAFYKDAVEGPRHVGREGLDGDEQRDKGRGHGGPHGALLMYAAAHYPRWRVELAEPAMDFGGFGENLDVEGFDETTVCIGDTFEIGDCVVQVASPRGPCNNISRRWKRPDMVKRVTDTGRTGWYLRVLKEGSVAAGQSVTLTARTLPEWTVARTFRLRVDPDGDVAGLEAAAALELLTPDWRQWFAKRVTERAS
jgi:MOSC domain-containing protein YiiM